MQQFYFISRTNILFKSTHGQWIFGHFLATGDHNIQFLFYIRFQTIKGIDSFHLEVKIIRFLLGDRCSQSVKIPADDYKTYTLNFFTVKVKIMDMNLPKYFT